MSKEYNVAVAGATGAVGIEMIKNSGAARFSSEKPAPPGVCPFSGEKVDI